MTLRTLVTCTLALRLTVSVAAAQPTDDAVAAEQLFREARALVAKRDHAAACPKFEASLALDAQLGTRLNLADCYEALGKLASAWAMFHAAADAARGAHDSRARLAADRAAALEPRLPRLVIRVADGNPGGLVIEKSGEVIEPALIGTAIYVDPGRYTIVARAPGYAAATLDIVAAEGKPAEITIPALPRDAVESAGVAPPPTAPVASPSPDRRSHPVGDRGRRRRVIGLAVGAGGLAAIGVGVGFGLAARAAWNGAFDDGLCTRDPLGCSPAGQDRTDRARVRAVVSTVAVGVGLAAVAVGAIVYVTAPRGARIVPTTDGEHVGIAITGGF